IRRERDHRGGRAGSGGRLSPDGRGARGIHGRPPVSLGGGAARGPRLARRIQDPAAGPSGIRATARRGARGAQHRLPHQANAGCRHAGAAPRRATGRIVPPVDAPGRQARRPTQGAPRAQRSGSRRSAPGRDRDARQGARSPRRLLRDGAGGRALPNASSGPSRRRRFSSRRNRYPVVMNRQCGSDSVRAREAPMKAKTLALLLFLTLVSTPAVIVLDVGMVDAITVYPIDRAQILAGSRFDFKVEFDGIVESADTKVTINGADVSTAPGRSALFVKQEAGVSASALILRDVVLA